jgi:hypothetical protein
VALLEQVEREGIDVAQVVGLGLADPDVGRTLSLRRPQAMENVVEPTPKRPVRGQRAMME